MASRTWPKLKWFNQSFLLTTEQHEISSNKIMSPLSVSINGFDHQYIPPQYYSIILVITMGDSANQAKTKCSHLLQKEGRDSGLHSPLSRINIDQYIDCLLSYLFIILHHSHIICDYLQN